MNPWRYIYAHLGVYVTLLALVAASALMAACASNPVARAETAQQKVYAVYGSYVIIEEQIAQLLAEDSQTPAAVQSRIISAVETTRPVMESMREAYFDYLTELERFQSQGTTADRLNFALDNLVSWTERAEDLLDNLRATTRGVR